MQGIELETFDAELFALELAEDYALSEASLSHFIRAAWDVLEPGKAYLHNWHIDAIAEHLEAVHAGDIQRLIINMPPRYMKSIAVTVCFPVWLWLRSPEARILAASYSSSLSIKHNVDRRRLIQSPWFQTAWSDRFQIDSDNNQKSEFTNNYRGHMIATSVGGGVTGKGGSHLITDDPTNPLMAASDVERQTANDWYDQTFSTRLDDQKTGAQIVVMQRLHEKDLTGHLIEQGNWEHLSLPMIATKKTFIQLPISGEIIKREEGDLLHPERDGPEEVEQKKRQLGSAGFQSQMQQDPQPQAGGFFKRQWWKFYSELPKQRKRRCFFIDCAEEPGVTNDYTVIAVWDETDSGFYVVSVWRNKVAFPQLERAVKLLNAQYEPDAIYIEKKSAGTQLIQNLRATTTLPVLKYDPKGRSKAVRASGAQPTVEAGNVNLPSSADWVEIFISEHEKFPTGENDDQVDTTSMAVEILKMKPQAQPKARIL